MTEEDRNPLGLVWEDFVGKYLLVGLTYTDMRGTMLRREQLHGRITMADPARGFTLALEGSNAGRTFSLPPDLRAFKPADRSEYRLQSTGEVVYDPDFLATWVLAQPDS